MSRAYDVAIVGLGAHGSACAHHFARRGARVLGLDRFAPPHDLGSSHGETRIIREAYFEDPRYVPMVQRAYALWRELEAASGETLMLETGGLMLGRPDSVLVRGAQASADAHGLAHERLSAAEIRRRFPVLTPGDDQMAIWEPRAGVLFPEACVRAHLALAARAGATLHSGEPVLAWKPSGAGFEIETAGGRYAAGSLVLAANAWLDRLLPGVTLPLSVTRQPLFWFEPRSGADDFVPGKLPIWIWEHRPDWFFYGFPAFHGEIKLARHMGGRVSNPDTLDRAIAPEETAPHRAFLAERMPRGNGELRRSAVCMYANTPDEHFLIDRHPAHPQVVVISACSGHGFKFSSAIGELAAAMLMDGASPEVLETFRWRW